MLSVDDKVLRTWTLLTVEVMTKAQKLAPLASGALEGSAGFLRAKLTPNGVESSVMFKVPYARKLNDKESGIILKERGEISYMVGDTVVKKKRKGRLGFLDIAVNRNQRDFNAILKQEISKQFLRI